VNQLVHWEIPSTDVKKSGDFYSRLFGWKLQGWSDTYLLFEVEGGLGGGINKVDRMPDPCVDVYVESDDIPATLRRVEELGGRTEQGKTEIGGGMGYMAFFRDPCGCRIGVWSKT
jgi:hypothetical protein